MNLELNGIQLCYNPLDTIPIIFNPNPSINISTHIEPKKKRYRNKIKNKHAVGKKSIENQFNQFRVNKFTANVEEELLQYSKACIIF